MLVLALDTTLASCSAAVFDSVAQRLLGHQQQRMDKGHAEAIAPMVRSALASAGVAATDLQRIAVTTGPGTFTGLRIGLSLAHGMGVALGCDVAGIDTLTATAAPLLGKVQNICVVHQAGATGKFYTARFVDGVLHGDLLFESLEVIAASAGPSLPLLIGTGADAVMTLAPHAFTRLTGHDLPLAGHFVRLAAARPAQRGFPQPIYLREPDAKPSADFRPEIIRLAQADDLAALSALHQMCFDHGWSTASLGASLSLAGAQALVAERDGRIRAFVLVQQAAGEAEIITLCTEPRWRRRALAEKLVAAARDFLRQHEVTKLHLEVAADNIAATALYAKLGFSVSGRRKGYYSRDGGVTVDALLMSLSP